MSLVGAGTPVLRVEGALPAKRTLTSSMFDLAILEGAEPLSIPGADEPGVEVWRDLAGVVCALGHRHDGQFWAHIPRIASYAFSAGSPTVEAVPCLDASPALVREAYARTVLPIVIQALGTEVLHASAILTPCGVVAFCAVSETGKSTFAYALRQRGYVQWADDAVAFEVRGDRIVSAPLPFSARLHDDARSALGPPGEFGEEETGVPEVDGPAPIAAVGLLVRLDESAGAAPTRIEWLTPTVAFARVLEHGHCFSLADEARKRRMMHQYLDLVSTVPTFVVTYPSGFENLPSALDAVAEAIDAACASRAPALRR